MTTAATTTSGTNGMVSFVPGSLLLAAVAGNIYLAGPAAADAFATTLPGLGKLKAEGVPLDSPCFGITGIEEAFD
jgi:hypothetical protein